MKEPANSTGSHHPRPGAEPVRKEVLVAVVGAVVLMAVVIAFKSQKRSLEPAKPATTTAAPELKTRPVRVDPPPLAPIVAPSVVSQPAPPLVANSDNAPPANSDPMSRSRQLVAELLAISSAGGPITSEQAAKFKQNLAELIRQGAASVPAIQEFLAKNLDSYYSGVSGGEQLGYSSLRAGLFDALKQIGGPEAQAAMVQTLQTTAVPSELLELAKNLEQLAPGQYREQILNATRETLSMASANQLGTNMELGPAFRVLQALGNANTIDDAARNDPAKFYDAVAMANLPDGQGLPSLIQMAEKPGGSQTVATEMIAQLASQNPQALETLTQMAQNGQIQNSVWVKLAPILGGNQYQIDSGSQSYTIVDGATNPDQINQRLALIDKLLGFVSDGSAAANALQHEREALNGKLGK